MTKHFTSNQQTDEPMVYQIRLRGHLGAEWSDWFDGMTITLEKNGDTLLVGLVQDQAALHGLFKKIRNVGMVLLSLQHIEGGRARGE